jgi:hypothetical protein
MESDPFFCYRLSVLWKTSGLREDAPGSERKREMKQGPGSIYYDRPNKSMQPTRYARG